jgi:hypothetical protein
MKYCYIRAGKGLLQTGSQKLSYPELLIKKLAVSHGLVNFKG